MREYMIYLAGVMTIPTIRLIDGFMAGFMWQWRQSRREWDE